MILKSLFLIFCGIFLLAFLLFFVPVFFMTWIAARLVGKKPSFTARTVLFRTEQGVEVLDKEPHVSHGTPTDR